LNDSETQILKDISANKEHLKISLYELEGKKKETEAQRKTLIDQIIKECENQNSLLEEVSKKVIKSDTSELELVDQLKRENENILKLLSLKNGQDLIIKESVQPSETLSKYDPTIKGSTENLLKLNEKISEVNKEMATINEDMISKENMINTLKNLQEKYLSNKRAFVESVENEKVQVKKTENITNKNSESTSNTLPDVDTKVIIENDRRIAATMFEVINQIESSNNIENVASLNKYLQFLTQKLSNISSISKDAFTVELLKISTLSNLPNVQSMAYRRIYSNIEIFNEFQLIKRDLMSNIIYEEFRQYPQLNNFIAVPLLVGNVFSKATGLLLNLLSPLDLPISGEECLFLSKIKALHALHVSIEIGNFVEAYRKLRYFKKENGDGVLNRLGYKLQVMAREQMTVDILRNQYI
jgi:hypothetical protein